MMDTNIKEKLSKVCESILFDEPLSKHTTFKIGGPADAFASVKDAEEIKNLIDLAKKLGISYFVMGNGSNLLVSDDGYAGLVIEIGSQMSEIEVLENGQIYAKAGALLSKIGRVALENELTGFEFASGIPGTLGGAVTMNAGAYGGEMKDIISSVDVLTKDGDVKTIPGKDMDFGYRRSVVISENYLVLGAMIKLEKGDSAAIKGQMDDLAFRRRDKQPLEFPSAGSTFKRPEGYFAGALIQEAGLKGYSVGGAQVSEKHAGFVINKGGATCSDVLTLISDVQRKVYENSGVKLEMEVKVLDREGLR